MSDKLQNFSYSELMAKISLILRPETPFYLVSIVYGVAVSVLTLAVPISVQSLVNTVTFGFLIQPLIVLSIVLLSILLFSSVLNALQTYMIELFQRHFYVRTTADMAVKLVNSQDTALHQMNGVELVNRYFDVMTVQKSITTLLTGGVSVILQTLVGMLLLGFYHPYFLIFDLVLIICLILVWALFGKKAIVSAKEESYSKYAVASWLEELARVNLFFKSRNVKKSALIKTDNHINQYLTDRKKHFRHVFYQTILLLTIHAFMSAIILGLGGFLVIKGELTLGQLVAAELVVTIILASFAKAGKYLESFYDLYAAVDKISKFYEIPIELEHSKELLPGKTGSLTLQNATYVTDRYTFEFNYHFEQGKSYFVHNKFYASKLVFIDLLQAIEDPKTGKILFDDVSSEDMAPVDIREQVYVLDRPTIFEGSLLENLTIGLEDFSRSEVYEVLDLVELGHLTDIFEQGLDTKIFPSGHPLWPSQILRLEVARAILRKPRVLILTEAFDQIEKRRRATILEFIQKMPIITIHLSHTSETLMQYDKYLFIDREKIDEFDTLDSLLAKSRSEKREV